MNLTDLISDFDLRTQVPAAGGRWQALFLESDDLFSYHDVVHWIPGEDGRLTGCVLSHSQVRRVDDLPGFCGYSRVPEIVSALPGMGWNAVFVMERGQHVRRPVVLWLVHDDGSVVPCDADDDGLVHRTTDTANFYRLEPPV